MKKKYRSESGPLGYSIESSDLKLSVAAIRSCPEASRRRAPQYMPRPVSIMFNEVLNLEGDRDVECAPFCDSDVCQKQ